MVVQAQAMWRRRNDAERRIRQAISAQSGLAVFGTGVEGKGRRAELFVTLTAADEAARDAAPGLLSGRCGLDESGWSRGWRRLQLGDWMIRLYPERSAS